MASGIGVWKTLSERNATKRKRAAQLAARSQALENEIAENARRARVRRSMSLLAKEAVETSAIEVLDEEEFRGYAAEWRALTASATKDPTRSRWRKLGREEKEREAAELARVREEIRVDFQEEPVPMVRKALRDAGLKKITATWYTGHAEYQEAQRIAEEHGGAVTRSGPPAPVLVAAAE